MQIWAKSGRLFGEKRSAIKAPVFISAFAPDVAMHNGLACWLMLAVSGHCRCPLAAGQSSGSAVSSLCSVAIVEASAMPSTLSGRKWRWKAVTAALVRASNSPCTGTS